MESNGHSRERRNEDQGTRTDSLDLCVLGVRCGNGLNKLEFALVRYRQDSPDASLRVELLKSSEVAVPLTIRNPILISIREQQHKTSYTPRVNVQLGQMFSSGIKFFCQNYGIAMTRIDFVGTDAPTLTPCNSSLVGKTGTDSLGRNTVIKLETGLTTVSDFSIVERAAIRSRISPVAFADTLLLRHPHKFRACLNINELSNITFIPPYTLDDTRPIISRDCGPGSLFIDYAMRYCTSNDHDQDHEGRYAASGQINHGIVDRFLKSHDYLRISPPLIMAREMFGDHDAQRLVAECLYYKMSEADTVATITRLTAGNIAKQYHRLLELSFPDGQKVSELFICGPSARNPHIIDYLESELPERLITKPLDDVGVPGDANEAFCYAHLALEMVLGQVTCSADPVAQTPPDDVVRGRVVPGENWDLLLNKVRRFSRGKPLYVSRDVRVAGNLEGAVRGLGVR